MKGSVKSSGFAAAPYLLMDQDIDPKAIVVYLWLHRFGWNSAKGCYASLQTISDRSRISRKVVQRSLNLLVQTGWVEIERRPGTTAVYHVVIDHPGRKRPKVENDPGQKRPRGQVKNDLGTQVENDLQTRTHEQEPITRTLLKLQSEFAAVSEPDQRRAKTKGDEAFERFWDLYRSAPRRTTSLSKPKALAQWQKTIRTQSPDTLIKALQAEIDYQHAAGDSFVAALPDCFRWLRDERYATVHDRPVTPEMINHDTYVF